MKKLARKMALVALRTFNPGRITIRHHYTGKPLSLDAYKHKGYWWYGKKREEETMQLFSRLIEPGAHVVEVGGHIGYIAQYYSQLVGAAGQVTIFEPGENNLPYLERNLKQTENTQIVRKAVSNETGTVKFYIENLTGQNNSLHKDFEGFQNNQKQAYTRVEYQEVEVPATTLDDFSKQSSRPVSLLKIDVEGAELLVLQGARGLLTRDRPHVMVEVADPIANRRAVFELMTGLGYELYTPEKQPIRIPDECVRNVFGLHPLNTKGWQNVISRAA